MGKIPLEMVKFLKKPLVCPMMKRVSFKHLPNLEMVLPSDNGTSQVRSLVSFSPSSFCDPVKGRNLVNKPEVGERNT